MNLSDNVLQNKMIVPECHGSIRTIVCVGIYIPVLLVISKEVLESSPEVEARSAAVYGKRGLASAEGWQRAGVSLVMVVCQDINRIRICSRSLELPFHH